MSDAETWGLVLQGLLVIATLAVAIMAVFGDSIRAKYWGPKLRLKLHDPEGESILVRESSGKMVPARYYHLKVTNERRSVSARNVRVMLTQIIKPTLNGTFPQQRLSGPLQLKWQHPEFHVLFSTIGPDDICDLGHVIQDRSFVLLPYIVPNNFEGFLKAGERMRIEVIAVADNAESAPLSLEISWNGKWSDDTEEMKKNFVIKEYK